MVISRDERGTPSMQKVNLLTDSQINTIVFSFYLCGQINSQEILKQDKIET
jgi:hypothetical protein